MLKLERESDWIDEAVNTWKKAELRLNAGATLAAIEKTEEELNFSFPQDFKDLYQIVNGFEDFEWNEYMFSLWYLERIIKEYQENRDYNYGNADFIGFCDYLINSHSIGFSKSYAGVFKNYGSELTEWLVSGFREAIVLINENSDLIY